MRIERHEGRIHLRDRPAPSWALGAFLFAGGALAIAMSLGLATNADQLKTWERLASIGIGIGVCAGALWWLARSPGTEVELDLTRRSLSMVRWSILGRQLRQLSFDQLETARVEEGEDDEGGKVWRPAVRLRDGEVLLLSELWSHDRPGVQRAVDTVVDECRLTSATPF